MRAWVAYRTFRMPGRDVRFSTGQNVLGADLLHFDSNFNLVIMRGPGLHYFPWKHSLDQHIDFITMTASYKLQDKLTNPTIIELGC